MLFKGGMDVSGGHKQKERQMMPKRSGGDISKKNIMIIIPIFVNSYQILSAIMLALGN